MVNKKTKMWISIVTAFTVLMAGAVAWMNPFATNTVSAGQYRDGYLLIPENYDLYGVSIDSAFTLLTQTDHTLEDIVANFYIDGESKPVIEKRSSKKFVITPVKSLEVNKLYTFRMQKAGYEDITWSFQTGYPFGVVSALPNNQSTGVPVNTGIELTFTHEGYQDLDTYFSITPNVKGTFERHGNTVVFVPNKVLAHGTVYTVTLKAGLALKDTDKSLQEDFIFSFETQPEDEKQSKQYQKGWFAFNRVLNEASSGEAPWLPVYYYIYNRYDNKSIEDMAVETNVYSLGDVQSFIDALKEKDKIPYWASYSVQNTLLPVTDLDQVMSFQQIFPGGNKTEEDNYLRLPDSLPKGFYLINTKWDDLTFQTLLQVTDVGIYSVVTNKEALIWLNTVGTGASIANAKIKAVDTGAVFTTDSKGVASFDPDVLKKDENQSIAYLQITAGKDHGVIRFENTYRLYGPYYDYFGGGHSEDYWSTFQLDRQLYKPDDTISFWGFLKERDQGQQVPSEVTVEIGNQYYRPFYAKSIAIWPGYQGTAIEKVTVKMKDGMFEGQIKIPNIQSGHYSITVKDKDVVLASSYINVEDYVKPAYTIEVTSDKKGVKNGDPVTFDIKASFFEGTPVSNLNIKYNMNFYFGNQYVQGEVVTDSNGVAKVSFIPNAEKDIQGVQSLSIYVRAQLPESGEISASHNVSVFVNDIHVQAQATLENEKDLDQAQGKIKIQVNHVDLEKYNSSDENDSMGGPVKGKTVQGSVIWNTWERKEVGKYYDYINKVTYPRVEYERKTKTVQTFTVKTDEEGVAMAGFTPLTETDGYYTVSIQTQDQSGRTIKYDHIYVSGSTRSMGYYPYSYDYYYLEKEKVQYKPGEQVTLTYKYGEKALEGGKFLFVKATRGNLEWDILDTSKLEFTMEDAHAPNIYVYGVWFNNRVNIVSRQELIQYDYSDQRMKLTAQTDKKTYRPGDTVTVKLSAEEGPGAFINLSLVDEALFALNDQYVNTLDQLYRSVSSGLVWEYRSHANSGRDVADGMAGAREESLAGGIVAQDNKSSFAAAPTASADQIAIREDFKDTALFKNIQLDDNGKGVFSFTLPDNITQWRITLSGVSKDLKAGTDLQSLDVSLPFFISYNSSETFLAGDKPVLGVTGYGTQLKADDQVQVTVKDKLTGATLATAAGAAFQRINLQMPVLQNGGGEWIIEAVTTGGLKDGVSHVYNTLESYHTMQKADYTDLTPYTVINGHNSRNLSLIFTDRTRGQWLPDIYSLSWTYGNRFEQKLGSRIARDLLVKYFDQEMIVDNSFKPKDYQVSDGGLGILPYAASDVFVTAWAVDLVKDEVNLMGLKEYLYGRLESESAHASRIAALYGLAVLKEPVMLELEKYSAKDSLSTEEALYLVLAYQTLGEKPVALDLYNRLVAPQLDQYESYAKVKKNTYMKTQDDVTRNTVIAAVAAVRLNLPEAEKLMNYVRMNHPEESLINLQKISYVNEVIDRVPGGNISVTYTWLGEEFTQEVGPGGSYTMNIPGAKAADFKVKSIEGEIGLVTVYEVMRNENVKTDPGIKVSRSYSSLNGQKGNMFKSGDIVEVTLNVTISKEAMDNYYKLSDYLPAGLKAIETPLRPYYDAGDMKITHWYKDVDGQKVSFYIFPYKDRESFTYTYYARIAAPGQYKAEAAVVQGVHVLDSTAATDDQVIYIQP